MDYGNLEQRTLESCYREPRWPFTFASLMKTGEHTLDSIKDRTRIFEKFRQDLGFGFNFN